MSVLTKATARSGISRRGDVPGPRLARQSSREALRKRAVASFLLLLLLLIVPAVPAADAWARPCAEQSRVERAARSFIAAARTGSPAAFARALRRHLAVRRIAMFALGRDARRMDRATRRRYLDLAVRYVARQMAAHSKGFRNARIRITGCRGNVVEGRILPGNRAIRWRLSRGRIVDVYMDGIWLAVALRSHFRDLLRRSRGDMKQFLAMLR